MFELDATFAKTFAKAFANLFKKSEIDTLAENFIVTKALQAFAQHGTIQKVRDSEDQVKNSTLIHSGHNVFLFDNHVSELTQMFNVQVFKSSLLQVRYIEDKVQQMPSAGNALTQEVRYIYMCLDAPASLEEPFVPDSLIH